jgi:hypothetical protein
VTGWSTHYYKRTLKRLDITSRSLFAVIEPGSCRWPRGCPGWRAGSGAGTRNWPRRKSWPGAPLPAAEAAAAGLVTFTFDDIDWDEELRIALEERASFSPDALTGMEAQHRFAGPETLETKIFGRLSRSAGGVNGILWITRRASLQIHRWFAPRQPSRSFSGGRFIGGGGSYGGEGRPRRYLLTMRR